MLNKFDRPAYMDTPQTARARLKENPIGDTPDMGSIEAAAAEELRRVLDVFRQADAGDFRGPFEITTPHFFTICFESYEQREIFRREMCLMKHGEQYWAGSAVAGTLDLLKTGAASISSFTPRANPFEKREVPRGRSANAKKANAEKYSDLRAEAKRTAEKLQQYTDDRSWIAVCFHTPKDMAAFRTAWGLPEGKFIHVDDAVAALATKGITLNIPSVPFALRAEPRPDKALNALVG